LTDKGLALTPLLVELATWSDNNLRDIHPTIVNGEAMEFLRNDKAAFANALVNEIQRKTGYNSLYLIMLPIGHAGYHRDAGRRAQEQKSTLLRIKLAPSLKLQRHADGGQRKSKNSA
jgi:hypothetical protein